MSRLTQVFPDKIQKSRKTGQSFINVD